MGRLKKEVAEMRQMMRNKKLIRNIGIIAHIDHGKTTLTDNLLTGLFGDKIDRWLDYLPEEQKRGITMKSANISFIYRMKTPKDSKKHTKHTDHQGKTRTRKTAAEPHKHTRKAESV